MSDSHLPSVHATFNTSVRFAVYHHNDTLRRFRPGRKLIGGIALVVDLGDEECNRGRRATQENSLRFVR